MENIPTDTDNNWQNSIGPTGFNTINMLDLGNEPDIIEAEPEVELLTFTDIEQEVELLMLDDFDTCNALIPTPMTETHDSFAGIALLNSTPTPPGTATSVATTRKGTVMDLLTVFPMSHWKKMQSCHACLLHSATLKKPLNSRNAFN